MIIIKEFTLSAFSLFPFNLLLLLGGTAAAAATTPSDVYICISMQMHIQVYACDE